MQKSTGDAGTILGRLTLRLLLLSSLLLVRRQVGDCLGWTAACTARGRTTRRGRGWESGSPTNLPSSDKTSHSGSCSSHLTSHLPPADGVESGAGGVGHRPGGTEQGSAVGGKAGRTLSSWADICPELRLDLARCLLLLLEKIQN